MANRTNSYASTSPSDVFFRAENIGKKMDDGTWLFRNVNLELKTGGVLTITGPSGIGKSTLLKCINQIIPMDEGKLWLNNKTPTQIGMPAWRSKVMYIPQRTSVMDNTPREFLEEVRKFNAHKKKDTYDDPIQIALDWSVRPELWDSKWGNLSGGEMQRISLAIGCSFRPEILLLDEPTSALDEESCAEVEKTLKELNCLWITHNPQQAARVSTAGKFVMRGGDNSINNELSRVVIESNGAHGIKNSNKSAASVSTHGSSTIASTTS